MNEVQKVSDTLAKNAIQDIQDVTKIHKNISSITLHYTFDNPVQFDRSVGYKSALYKGE